MSLRPLPLVLGAYFLILPSMLVLSSHTLSATIVVAALVAGLAAWREGRGIAWPDRRLLAGFALLLAWCATASLWSFDVERSLLLALRLGGLVACGAALWGLAERLTPEERGRVGRWLIVGFGIALALFLFERLTGSALHHLLGNPHPDRTVLSLLNRGATGLALLVWPVTALLLRGPLGRLALLLPAALLAALLFYESLAALLGTAVGLGALLLGLASARGLRLLATACVLLGLLAAPLAAKLIFTPDAYTKGWVDTSGQHRLHIWNFVAERALERPLLGWGFDSSRDLSRMGIALDDKGEMALPSHPHNGALQVWLELGVIGAAILTGLLLVVVRLVGRLGGIELAAAGALLLAGLTIACVSYGLWQSQWIALLLSMGLIARAVRAAPADAPER